jgi:hypothetical protein
MKQLIDKLLEINGVTILSLTKNGFNWIALQPICEVLNVNYDIQYQNLKANLAFGADLEDLQIQVPGEEERVMACLTENSVYGWIFTIPGEKPDFIVRQKECNDILFNYFHSPITIRAKLFEEKAKVQVERAQLSQELRSLEKFVKLEHLIAREAQIGKELKNMNENAINEQLKLFIDQN